MMKFQPDERKFLFPRNTLRSGLSFLRHAMSYRGFITRASFWKTTVVSFLLLLISHGLLAQSSEGIKKSTDVLVFLPAAASAGIAIATKDKKGALQFALSGASAVASSYLLEMCVKKRRPDGTSMHAFPSTHATVAFQGAAYLQRRYGWKAGAPAYAVATYVAWGRVFSKRHDVWDVLAGAALGAGCSYVFTRPFAKGKELQITPMAMGDRGMGVCVSMKL